MSSSSFACNNSLLQSIQNDRGQSEMSSSGSFACNNSLLQSIQNDRGQSELSISQAKPSQASIIGRVMLETCFAIQTIIVTKKNYILFFELENKLFKYNIIFYIPAYDTLAN